VAIAIQADYEEADRAHSRAACTEITPWAPPASNRPVPLEAATWHLSCVGATTLLTVDSACKNAG
jgi:hypothetical protein